jgi:flagellin
MSVVINTNYAATVASNNLAHSSQLLEKSLNRLSSGSKIVNPADDAGGLAVSMKLSAAAVRQGAVATNVANAVSLLQTQDGVLKVTGSILQRISELKVLNGDITKSTSDKANYQTEFAALQAQLNAQGTEKFNGVSLFGSTSLNVVTTEDGTGQVTVQGVDLLGGTPGTPVTINFNTNSTVTAFSPSGAGTLTAANTLVFTGGGGWGNVIGSLNAGATATYDGAGGWSGLTFGSVSGASVNIDDNNVGATATFTPSGVASNTGLVAAAGSLSTLSLGSITSAIADIATNRAQNGASQSRLGFAAELLTVNKANLESATSRITDVDVAAESTTLARYNILVQAGTSMLSQANQSARIALKLLQ